MKKNNLRRILAFILLTVMLFGITVLSSCQPEEDDVVGGTAVFGPVMCDRQSPAVLERQKLTFNISELPDEEYIAESTFLKYSSSCTAEYTVYNPTEETLTATLLLPLGPLPEYAGIYYDKNAMPAYFDNLSLYDVKIDGADVEKTLRHSLEKEEFYLEKDKSELFDGFKEDAFFKQDTPVTKYVFEVSGMEVDAYEPEAAFDLPKMLGDYRVYLPADEYGLLYSVGEKEYKRAHIPVYKNGYRFEMYVIGGSFMPNWAIYEGSTPDDYDKIPGTVTLVSTENTDFKAFALSGRDAASPVSEVDWYNAVISDFNSGVRYEDYPIAISRAFQNNLGASLLRWYEYKITVAPGARAVNTVTAPVYPLINREYSPYVYEFSYSVAPAKTFSSQGELEIQINTPFFLTESKVGEFTENETGFNLKLSAIPEYSSGFSICAVDNPDTVRGDLGDLIAAFILIATIIFFIFGLPILVGMIVVGIPILIVRKKRYGKYWKNKSTDGSISQGGMGAESVSHNLGEGNVVQAGAPSGFNGVTYGRDYFGIFGAGTGRMPPPPYGSWQGYPPNYYPPNGFPTQQLPPQYPQNCYPQQQYPPYGFTQNGASSQQPPNSISPQQNPNEASPQQNDSATNASPQNELNSVCPAQKENTEGVDENQEDGK